MNRLSSNELLFRDMTWCFRAQNGLFRGDWNLVHFTLTSAPV